MKPKIGVWFSILVASNLLGHHALAERPPASSAGVPTPVATVKRDAIFSALDDSSLDKARAILEADPKAANARNDNGDTPMLRIAKRQVFSVDLGTNFKGSMSNVSPSAKAPLVAELLISKGADVNSKDVQYGATPLIWALATDKAALSVLLIAHGADVNAKDKTGATPLMWAIGKKQPKVTKLLIEHGVRMTDPFEYKGLTGLTPIHLAIKVGDSESVRLLLGSGLDVNIKDRKGRTPLKLANTEDLHTAGHKEIVTILQAHGGTE